jgi:DNA polymerase III subunit gamma/tau
MTADPSSTVSTELPASARSGESLALYRRYRPATFAEVKGQDQVTQPLIRALTTDRISHAYLFSGPRGCGKTTSARILARSLNCVNGPTPEPCGKCDSCLALAPNGPGSIDVIEIDAASHGGVDDARDLRERAFYAPVSGRFKIYIIDEAHMVTREGFNALLRLVEEPPAHLKFIFATTEPEKVIPTIRSRTHHYPFRLVPPAVLRELLADILGKEGVAWEPEVLPLVIRAGAGSVRDSLSVLDQLLAGADEAGLTYEKTAFLLGYTDAALLDEVTDAFAAGDGAAVFKAVDRVMGAGLDPRRFAADLLDRLRDLIVLTAVPDAERTGLIDAPADRLERMRAQADRFGLAGLTRAAEVVSDGLVQMRGATAPRLLLELMCAQVLLPGAAAGQSALLARLERLERSVASGSAQAAAGTSGPPASGPPVSGPKDDPPARRAARAAGTAPIPPASVPAVPAVPPDSSRAAEDPRRRLPPQAGESPPDSAGGDSDFIAPPEASAPATSAAPTAGAARPVDADSLRRDWPRVLDAVKRERRVAWILLSNATVHSLQDGVLTVRFAREGDMRGFTSSGRDADLSRVLAREFGMNVQVKAISSAAARDFSRRDSGPDPAPSAAGDSYLTRPRETSRDQPASVVAGQPQPVAPAPAPAAGAADEGDPFDVADPDSSGGEPGLTGMDLIKRELGGEIIDEIEHG